MENITSQSRLGVGVIGAGAIARNHAEAYRSLPDLADLIAVADIDCNRAEAAKQEHGFHYAFQNYQELLSRKDIDVVSICTPPNLHTQVVTDALAAGKDVLCEKPIAHTLESADTVIQATIRYSGSKVCYVFQYRSDPAHARVRQLIADGALGRLLLAKVTVRAHRTAAYYARVPGRGSWASDGGGVLVSQSIHQLDALISFMGKPVEVSAAMSTFLQPTEAEDTLVAWIRFESGAMASLDCTSCAHEDWFTIEVVGENAETTVRGSIDLQHCDWSLHSKSTAVQTALRTALVRKFPDFPRGPSLSSLRAQKLLCKLRGQQWRPPGHWGHAPYIREFLTALIASKNVPAPPFEARKSLELAVALYVSAVNRKNVELPIDRGSCFYRGIIAT